jgi:hypothetical protein
MAIMVNRSGIAVLILGVALGTLLFLIDHRESHWEKFRSIQLGMSIGDATRYLNDLDGPLCGGALRRTSADCWFRDDSHSYRVVFDPQTGQVSAKFSWRRRPRSVLDRLCSKLGFTVPY